MKHISNIIEAAVAGIVIVVVLSQVAKQTETPKAPTPSPSVIVV